MMFSWRILTILVLFCNMISGTSIPAVFYHCISYTQAIRIYLMKLFKGQTTHTKCRDMHSFYKMVLVILLCRIDGLFVNCQYETSTIPRNLATLKGSTSTLECSFKQIGPQQENVEWLFIGDSDLAGHRISFNGKISNNSFTNQRGGHGKYNIITNYSLFERHYSLVIKNISELDSNLYVCRAIQSDILNAAYILLFDDHPQCISEKDTGSASKVISSEGSNVSISCNISYSGAWTPRMFWEVPVNFSYATHNFISNNKLANNLFLGPLCNEYNDKEVKCVVSFPLPPLTITNQGPVSIDRRSPSTQVGCAVNIDVKYHVRDVQLEYNHSAQGNILIISCSARGNPEPDVLIIVRQENGSLFKMSNESIIKVSKRLSDSSFYITCLAKNVINGKMNVINMTELIYSKELDTGNQSRIYVNPAECNNDCKVAVSVFGAMLATATIIIVIIYMKKKVADRALVYADNIDRDDVIKSFPVPARKAKVVPIGIKSRPRTRKSHTSIFHFMDTSSRTTS